MGEASNVEDYDCLESHDCFSLMFLAITHWELRDAVTNYFIVKQSCI